MPAGRPTDYTKELSDKLCEKLSDGMSLRKICESDEFPCKATIFSWLRTNDEFLDQYTRAKEECADSYVDDMDFIAENIGSPVMDDKGELVMVDGKPLMHVDMVAINHARLRIDTKKWIASKLKAKKYGDKIDHTHGGGDKPIEHSWTVEVIDAKSTDT